MQHLIVGLGEIGSAIYDVLNATYEGKVFAYDIKYPNLKPKQKCDVLHVCFPPTEDFEAKVQEYKNLYINPNGIVIVHSTVPIGTNDKLGSVASPVRGIHPNLVPGIRTFVKYFGGKDAYKASKIFEGCQIQTRVLAEAKDVEALKLWDTTQFGWMILLNKAMKEWCDRNGINFEIVYREGNITYNVGYQQLGQAEFARPFFDFAHGPIGGHCVMQNAQILKSGVADFINKINEELNNTGKTGL